MIKKFSRIHPTVILASFVIALSSLFPQTIVSIKDKNGASGQKSYPPGTVVTAYMKADSTIGIIALDPNEYMNVIVKFRGEPVQAQKLKSSKQSNFPISEARQKIQLQHSSFRNDLFRLESAGSSGGSDLLKSANTQIRFEYNSVLNGFSVFTRRWMAEEIKKLSYVESVYEDKEVKAFDDISNHVI